MAIPKGGSFNHGHHGGGGGGGHDTHGDRHKGTTPGGTGGGVTGGTAGHQSHHPSGGYVGHPLAWVVRRQQVLRRAGFNIAVDGIYGPATSAAWASFLSGINHGTNGILHGRGHDGSGIPPGYVYYKGHLVSHEQSKLLHRVTRLVGQATTTAALAKSADVGRHAALARHVASQIALDRRQQRDLSQRHLLLHDVAGRIGQDAKGYKLLPGEDPNVAFQRRVARERRVTQQELLRDGKSLDSARVRGRLDGLFGGDFKNRYLHPDYLLHRAAHGQVDASDLTFLMHEGLLGGDDSDVRTIQQVINHDGGHVTVNGQFDQQTFDGLDQLYAREARREFASQIDAITTEFYHDDIARAATTAALGVNHKLLTPAQLLHLLQTGGPGADRMGSALAHYVQFNTRQQALWKLQAQRANQILKSTGPISRSLARDTLRASGQAQDQALGEADTLSQFSMILAIKQDNAERLLAQWAASHQPGFFSELADGAAGLVGSGIALGYHYSGAQYAWNAVAEGGGKVNDAWNWTQFTHNSQRAALGLGDLIASYTGGWDPTLQHPDGLSVMEAWQQSDAHLSELQSQGGVNALIFESLVDPLNFVGAGAVAAVFDGIKFGLRIGEIGAAVGVLRGTDVVDRLAPEISVALHDRLIRPVYRAHAFADTVHDESTFAAIGDTALAARARETRLYKMASVTRSVAQRAVEDRMTIIYGALRPVASRQVAVMRGLEGDVGRLADEFDKAALNLPADFAAQGQIDSAAQVAALDAAAPHLSSAIRELGATLHLSPGGRLSFTGRRIRAWFMENARRQASARFLILDDLAKQEIDDSIRVGLRHLSLEELIAHHQHYYPGGRLDELLRNAGSWFGGGLPDEFYGPLTRELQLFRERLTKQILPAFDEMLLADGAKYPHVIPGVTPTPEEHYASIRGQIERESGGSGSAPAQHQSYVPTQEQYDAAVNDPALQALGIDEEDYGFGVERYIHESTTTNDALRQMDEVDLSQLGDPHVSQRITDDGSVWHDANTRVVAESMDASLRAVQGNVPAGGRRVFRSIRVGSEFQPPVAGGVIFDKGFWSTSTSPESSAFFLDREGDVIVHPETGETVGVVGSRRYRPLTRRAVGAEPFNPGEIPHLAEGEAYFLDIAVPEGSTAYGIPDSIVEETVLRRGGGVFVTEAEHVPGAGVYAKAVWVEDRAELERLAAAAEASAGQVSHIADDTGQLVRDAINRLMGFDVDHLYNEANWVDAPNPNFGHTYRPDSARFRQRTELARYEDSRTDYADYLVAIGQRTVEEAAAWVAEKVAAKRTELASAWKKQKHGWVDTRETVLVPEPSVGGLLARSHPGHADARDLIDVTTSYNRMPRKAFKSVKQLPSPEDIQSIVGRMGDGSISAPEWLAHVRASQKLEVIHAIAERHSLSQLYFDESLLWDGLREHQARSARATYFGFVTMLGVWKTAVLPLRPAFVVRNVLDNQAKMMLEGYRDPSLFFRQAGDSVKSVLGELFVRPMRAILTQVDALLGTDLLLKYDWLIGRFWFQSSSALEKLMLAHGIPHPPELFRATLGDVEVGVRNPDLEPLNRGVGAVDSDVRAISRIDPEADHPLARFKKYVWDIAASGPEGYQSRVLYVSKYRQELARGATEMEAMDTALKTVHKALFDYSTVTVLEDTLKVVAPFLFFWRKNAGFWANQVVEKPWFFYQGNKMYEAHRDSNSDQPEWMRRYVSLSPLASLTDELPHMQWASDYFRTANFDPLTFSSMVSFYRAFVQGNPELPPDQHGVAYISALINGFDSVGLGINPFLRSAGARLGLLDMRSWQDVFPQTTIFQSLTSEQFIQDTLGTGPNGFNPEDWFSDTIFQALGSDISEQGLNYDRFQYYVGQELAAQIARGEKPDRAAATKTIQRYLLFQNLTGYALGVFPRRISADDQQIYLISDKVRQIYADEGLSPDQQREQVQSLLSSAGSDLSLAYSAYTKNRKLFKAHGYSAAAFDRWLIGAKAAQAFFAIDDFDEQQKFLSEHPEALPIINPVVDGREIPSGYIKNQVLLADTASAIELGSHFLDGIDAAFDVKKAIGGALVYPELQAYWAKNDTPEQTRQRQVAGAYFGYLAKVNDTYFAIPEGDFDARTNYLAAHPELQQYWAKNDTASDDYRAIQLSANSTFRTIYFRLVDAGDWDAADAFLKRHSFIFDYTSAEGRVTPDGHWLPRSKAASDYAAVSSLLKVYYSFRDPKLAHEYLVAHPQVQRWLKMYEGNGGLQQEAADYDKIRALLDGYFALDSAGKAAYLAAHPELKAYFAKYGHNRSESQHARDYLAVKPQLDAFFDLPESERSVYLAKHPDLQAYFAKYGHHSTHGRLRSAIAADPEIKQRYDFWTHFFALPPNERPRYVHLHAEEAGVFIYGSLAGNWRHDIEQKWHRDAIRFGHTEKAQAYVTIKPLMDIYFKLKPGSSDRALFLQTNPELQVYFETFAPTLTGDPGLDKLVKEYLRLPQFSSQRSQFIVDHPEISVYFNSKANPKELAMQRLVDGYFSLPFGPERDKYLFEHPEVKIYFDQRHHQNDLFSSIAAAFNETDPRMTAFYEQYADIIPLDAIKQFQLHAQRVHEIIDKGARRERAPEKPAQAQTRRERDVPA